MPTIEKHSAYINFENGKKHKIDMDGSVMGATLRLSPHITIFDKDVFNIPAGSTINSVTVKFLGWQYRSNTNLYAARWGLKDIRHHVGWDGVYGSFNEYSSRLKNGEFSLITDYSVASRTHETGKMKDKPTEYSFPISNYCTITRDMLMSGLYLTMEAIYQGTLDSTLYMENFRVEVDYTPPALYYLDLDGWINGAPSGGISPAGTAEVYINGVLATKEGGDTDYHAQHTAGTTYEIKNIKANTGWKYDGVHSGSLSGTINGTTSVVLAFSEIKHTVTVTAGTGGTVTGSGTYDYGAQVTITATPNTGYHFVRWSDGNTSQTRTVTVTSNVTYIAVFEKLKHTVNLSAGEGGSVTGGGTYDYGTSVTIKAVPNTGYHFVRWSDGNTNAERTLTVTANVSLTAYFESDKINKVFSGSTNTNVYIGSAEAGSVSVGNTKIYG